MYKKSFKKFKKESLKDPEVKKYYEQAKPKYDLMILMFKKRKEEGLTQKELAKRMGTKQSAISRFESGRGNPTTDFMYRLADALGAKMKITITPR